MTRLIDAEKLKKHYAWWDDDERRTLFDQIVDAQPAVDAVPVIRCKDCKYWNGAGKFCDYEMSGLEEDYCSWAEPKDITEEVHKQLKDMEQRREMDRKK